MKQNNLISILLILSLQFSVFTISYSQIVRIQKNANNDPIIEFQSPEFNMFLGDSSGHTNLGHNNTSLGYKALLSNTSGFANVGIGAYSLKTNTYGYANVGIGANSLKSN